MIDSAAYKKAMRYVPGAVSIITARLGETRVGMTATALCSVSAEPPMLLACINVSARSCEKIRRSGRFTVNLLSKVDVDVARHFFAATDMESRFKLGEWLETESGGLVLASACTTFECSLAGDIPAGTHAIFLGRVEAANVHPERAALVYVDGHYTTIAA